MTKEEAIEMLVNATYSDEWQGNEKLTTAHLMAIEALQIDIVRCGECKHWKRYDTTIFKGPAFAPCLRSDGMNAFTARYDYCSHGVRRDNE